MITREYAVDMPPKMQFYSDTSHYEPDGRDAPAPQTIEIHNSVALRSSNVTKLNTNEYEPGQFCDGCAWNKGTTRCGERLAYLVTKYDANETEARESLMNSFNCTVPTIYHKVYSEKNEPSIILHVGPHKTGTTALQSFIYELAKSNNTIFLKDNLRIPTTKDLPGVYDGAGTGINLAYCSVEKYKQGGGQMSARMCTSMQDAFPKFVLDAYNKSQNILIVAEDFDIVGMDFSRLHHFLLPYKKIKIISTYRRLHEWLYSWYNQIVNAYRLIYATGDEKYPTFVEWLRHFDSMVHRHGVAVAERYNSYKFIESVHLINMHDVGRDSSSVPENFFCNILQTETVCNAIKAGARPQNENIGHDHEYERLAIEAKLAGKIPEKAVTRKLTLARSAAFLKKQIDLKNITLPIICPSEEIMEKMFQHTVEHEKKYLLEWHESQGGEEGLRDALKKAGQKKMCAYDTVKILDEGILDDIFSKM
ncbi:hypothetical protein ACHAWC_009057 [Mediolabrus comicus]